MENFFYEDNFYSEIGDLLMDLDIDEDDIPELPEDWEITVHESSLEPLVTLSVDWIMDRINEERFSEEGNEYDKIHKIISDSIDFIAINEKIPQMYYPTKKTFKITKADLLV